MSWPSATITPVVGVTIPQMMLIRVDLPAPLGPSRANISPFAISRSMRFKASSPDAYFLVRFEMVMIGDIGVVKPLERAYALHLRRQRDTCKRLQRDAAPSVAALPLTRPLRFGQVSENA